MIMRKIYLRLIEADDLNLPESQRLIQVKNAVEAIVSIKWFDEPQPHIKAGYMIKGEVADDINLDSVAVDLRERGYLIVI